MNSTPRSPPISARGKIGQNPASISHRKSTGSVKMTPAASDSPAEPIVCTMFVSSRVPVLNALKIATPMTAAGIEADTVRPTLRPR